MYSKSILSLKTAKDSLPPVSAYCCLIMTSLYTISLISSFSNFLTSSHLVRFFRLTAPAAMLGHLGAISLKILTKRKEVRKLEKKLIRLIIFVSNTKNIFFHLLVALISLRIRLRHLRLRGLSVWCKCATTRTYSIKFTNIQFLEHYALYRTCLRETPPPCSDFYACSHRHHL